MKKTVARWCASLIIDEWPLPRWLEHWLRRRACVDAALEQQTQLEDQLRASSGTCLPLQRVERYSTADWNPTFRRTLLVTALAVAASLLIILRTWSERESAVPSGDRVTPIATAVDQEPVLVSITAGRKVINSVYSGLENVATDLAGAGNRLATPLLSVKLRASLESE